MDLVPCSSASFGRSVNSVGSSPSAINTEAFLLSQQGLSTLGGNSNAGAINPQNQASSPTFDSSRMGSNANLLRVNTTVVANHNHNSSPATLLGSNSDLLRVHTMPAMGTAVAGHDVSAEAAVSSEEEGPQVLSETDVDANEGEGDDDGFEHNEREIIALMSDSPKDIGAEASDQHPKRKSASDFEGQTNIYVGKLPSNFTHGQVSQLFSQFGDIESMKLELEHCYGFINFVDPTSARAAIRQFGEPPLKDLGLNVTYAVHSEAEPEPSERVFIRGLPPFCTRQHILRLCSPFGHVASYIVLKFGDGRCRGSGFASFESVETARKAIEGLNNQWVTLTHHNNGIPTQARVQLAAKFSEGRTASRVRRARKQRLEEQFHPPNQRQPPKTRSQPQSTAPNLMPGATNFFSSSMNGPQQSGATPVAPFFSTLSQQPSNNMFQPQQHFQQPLFPPQQQQHQVMVILPSSQQLGPSVHLPQSSQQSGAQHQAVALAPASTSQQAAPVALSALGATGAPIQLQPQSAQQLLQQQPQPLMPQQGDLCVRCPIQHESVVVHLLQNEQLLISSVFRLPSHEGLFVRFAVPTYALPKALAVLQRVALPEGNRVEYHIC